MAHVSEEDRLRVVRDDGRLARSFRAWRYSRSLSRASAQSSARSEARATSSGENGASPSRVMNVIAPSTADCTTSGTTSRPPKPSARSAARLCDLVPSNPATGSEADGERRWRRKPAVGEHLGQRLVSPDPGARRADGERRRPTRRRRRCTNSPHAAVCAAESLSRAVFLVERHRELAARRRQERCATARRDRLARRIARLQRREQESLRDRALTNQLRCGWPSLRPLRVRPTTLSIGARRRSSRPRAPERRS